MVSLLGTAWCSTIDRSAGPVAAADAVPTVRGSQTVTIPGG